MILVPVNRIFGALALLATFDIAFEHDIATLNVGPYLLTARRLENQ